MGFLDEKRTQGARVVRMSLSGLSGYAIVGLAFFWQMFRHGFWDLTLIGSPDVVGGMRLGYSLVVVLSALFGVIVLLFLRRGRERRFPVDVPRLIVVSCLVASVFCFLSLFSFHGPLGLVVDLARSLFLAASVAALTIGWGVASASRFSGKVVVEFALSYFLGFVLMAPEFLPFPFNHFVAMASPGIGGLMLALHVRRHGMAVKRTGDDGASHIVPLLTAFVVISAFTRGFLNDGTSVSASSLFLTTGISLIFSFFIIVIVIHSKRGVKFVYVTWMVFVILYLLGIFLVVAAGDAGTYFGKACMLFTGSSFWFLLFAVFADEGGSGIVAVVRRFVVLLALMAVSTCIAYVLVPFMRGFAQELNVAVTNIVFLTTAFIFVAVSFAFFSRVVLEREQSPTGPEATDEACDRIAVEFGLTSRETDVLHLVPTGYTYKKIGSTLYISPNTVLSHMKSIYRKTGANGKQELLDLIEGRLA